MGEILRRRIGLPREPHLGESVALALAVAAGDVGSLIAGVLTDHGLNHTQYAVLRMLRGAAPHGLRHAEIGRRLVLGNPDVTRLTGKLADQGWITRDRDAEDRRVVQHRITARGREALDRLAEPLEGVYDRIVAALGAEAARDVVAACELAIAARVRMVESGGAR